jgi:hypothetical protein
MAAVLVFKVSSLGSTPAGCPTQASRRGHNNGCLGLAFETWLYYHSLYPGTGGTPHGRQTTRAPVH